MKKIGLALGGGGARGLCHIEFCKALDELGLKPAVISGTSIGSIVGAFYAGGMAGSEMKKLTSQLSVLDYTKMVDFSIHSRGGIMKGKNVMDFLRKNLPVKTFEELPIPLKIIATDYWKRRQLIFDTGELIPAIRASISIPVIFEPVQMNEIIMIDGGAVNPVPMSVIRDKCDLLIAIDVSGTNTPPKKKSMPSMFDTIINTFHISETVFVENQLKTYHPEIYIKPQLVNIQILDFHRSKEIMESVRQDVLRFKEELRKQLAGIRELKPKKKKRFRIF
ncbi:patatin-like phospholipase family protein [bacterium]|nr:patatin-like phospholipase family protein [bacterium]